MFSPLPNLLWRYRILTKQKTYMIQLYSQEEYQATKSMDKLPLKCYYCSNTFYLLKKYITHSLSKGDSHEKCRYCNRQCQFLHNTKRTVSPCGNCGTMISKAPFETKKSKSKISFCNKSCAAIYNNTHKETGTRRSKLESWIEEKLKTKYTSFSILFNDKTIIGSELDICIPSLNVSFELNGIFHYKPIYGEKKLAAIQAMDAKKKESCDKLNIELHILDVSSQSIFSVKSSEQYLQYICEKIDGKLTS